MDTSDVAAYRHACGENPRKCGQAHLTTGCSLLSFCHLDGVYGPGFTRMDTTWAFREAYEKARLIKHSQDEFCSKAIHGEWAGLGEFPEDLQWEALVDVLRGRVKVRP